MIDARIRSVVEQRSSLSDEPICLYVYDLAALRAHVRAVVAALPPRCRMLYAVKANSAGPILDALAPLVHGFEVASAGELEKVRALGGAHPVAVGGPVKPDRTIAAAIAHGARRLHVESVHELHRISAIATRLRSEAEVLLRVNLAGRAGRFPAATLQMAGAPTQFGIDEAALDEAVAAARALPGIELAGFHLHSLSNNLDADAHLELIALYARAVRGWEERYGVRCSTVDVGGGIGIDYADLDRRFDWGRFTRGLAELLASGAVPPHWRTIDFECGRFLVAGCGSYVAEVADVKRNHGVAYALVRGGTHHFRLPASWQHSHPFSVLALDADGRRPAPRPQLRDVALTVCGELCTPKDVLARAVPVERVRVGDALVFHHAGAYGWEISHHDFLSHPHPEQVFLA